ncbi:MAG TPA: glycoside hydrolase family 3 protein [Woeseiaceae bacterium]
MRPHLLILAVTLPLASGLARAAPPPLDLADWPRPPARAQDPALEARVSALLARMSLEEKVGQVIQADISAVTPEDVRRFHLGSVLNGGNSGPGGDDRAPAQEWLALADAFWLASIDDRDGGAAIPVIWGTDAVHGHANIVGATVFPHNIGLGATGDADLVRRIGRVTAREIAVTGMDWDFAPTVAVVRNDRWGRTYEGFSEDPAIVGRLGAALVAGLQGSLDDPERLDGTHVIATAKHFIGDGGTADGIDQGDNRASPDELLRIHAAGYLGALEAGVETIMASYNSWHGAKVHGYRPLLTDLLKEHWGFDGFVVGDWNAHAQVEGCEPTSCPQAFNAGIDMFMAPDSWRGLYENTLASVRSGEIATARLDDAVRRILRVKFRAGVMDRPRPSERPLAGRFERLGAPEHRAVAREAVRESLVLLKNEGGVLPIAADARVLLAGPAADDVARQAGGWTLSWQGDGNRREDFPHAETIREALAAALTAGGGRLDYRPDGRWSARPEVAVLVFGEVPYAEGAGDRPDVDFRGSGLDPRAVLERWRQAGIPTVSVFLSGRPLYVGPELAQSDAFVAAWLPGSEGGGVADVLVGNAGGAARHDFTGRLPYSWPRAPQQVTVNAGAGGDEPQFPLGYGLTYGASTGQQSIR